MTTPSAPLQKSVQPAYQDDSLPEYPRMAHVMDRLRAVSEAAAANERTRPISSAMIEQHAAIRIFDGPTTGTPAFAPLDEAPTVVETPVPAPTQTSHIDAPVLAQAVVLPAVRVSGGHGDSPDQVVATVGTEIARVERANMNAVTYDEHDFVDDEYALVQHLTMRDTAREALRARMIHYGEARRHYSAYDVVVMMMGFGIMVLLAAPPIVRIVHAIQGTPVAG